MDRTSFSLALVGCAILTFSTLVLLAAGSLPPQSPSALADGPGDWPMFRYEPAHSGYTPSETSVKPPLRLKWSYNIEGGSIGSSPAVSNGRVFVSADNGRIYAFNALTGALLWSAQASSGVSSPAVADALVYVGAGDGKLNALDAQSGKVMWSFPTGGAIVSSPTVSGGTAYVGSNDGKLYALDAASGDFKWAYSTGGAIDRSSPAVAGDLVYIGSSDGKLHAVAASSGDLRWAVDTGNTTHRSSPSVAGGKVFIGSYSRSIYALDARTGEAKWTYPTDGAIDSSPAVANGLVYVGSYDGKLYALGAADGAMMWSYSNSIGSVASAPAVANGLVYVGSSQEGTPAGTALLALDAQTGDRQWSYLVAGPANCGFAPPAVANGILYAGACVARGDGQWPPDGRLYAFESESAANPTPTPSPSPTATPTATPTPTPFIPNLSITNLASRDRAYPGEALSYLVLLDNNGPLERRVSITDTIPSNTSYITGTLPGGAVYSNTIRSVIWAGAVPPGLSGLPPIAFLFKVKVDSEITANAITNTLLVSSGSTTVASSARTSISFRSFFPLFLKANANW